MRSTNRSESRWRSAFGRVKRALRLDPFLYREAAGDASLTREAVFVAVISALVMGLGLTLVRIISPLWWLVSSLAWATAQLGLGAWFFVAVGRRFGSSVRYDQMVRALGYAVVPQALGFVPIANFVPGFVVGGLWATAGVVVAVREVHGVPTGLAVRLVAVPILMLVAVAPLVVTATQA